MRLNKQMRLNKTDTPFFVGTRFIASGDSSPCIRMNPGSKRGERVHGDESLDGI